MQIQAQLILDELWLKEGPRLLLRRGGHAAALHLHLYFDSISESIHCGGFCRGQMCKEVRCPWLIRIVSLNSLLAKKDF